MADDSKTPGPSMLAYGLLALLTVAPLLEGGSPYPALMLLRVGIVVLTAGVLLKFFRAGRISLPRSDIYPIIGLFMLFVLGTTLASPYANISIEWTVTLLMYLLCFGLTLALFQGERAMLKGLALLVAVGVGEALLGLAQYGQLGYGRATGTFFNPNFLGGFLVPLIVLTAAFLLACDRDEWARMAPSRWLSGDRFRALAVVALALMLAGLVVTASRGAVLGLFAAAAAVLIFRFRKRGAFILAVGVILFMLIPNPVMDRFTNLPAQDPYAYTRSDIWKSTGHMIVDHPAGIGLGMFKYYWPKYNFPVQEALARYGRWSTTPHSEYLQLTVELGIGALVVFLLGLGVFGTELWRALSKGTQGAVTGIALGLSAGLIGVLTHALVDSNLHEPAIALLFAFSCGLLLCVKALRRPSRLQRIALPKRDRAYYPFYRVAVVTLAGLIGVLLLRPMVAYTYAGLGHRALAQHRIDEAIRHYDRAVWWDPGKTQHHSNHAAALFQKHSDTGEMDWANDAIFELNYARYLNPRNEEFPRQLGYVYAVLALQTEHPKGQRYLYKMALQHYQHAINRNPYQAQNFQEMGKIYLRLDDPDSAELVLRHAVDLEPNYLPARLALGELYTKEGRPRKAQREYQLALNTLNMFPGRASMSPLEQQFLNVDTEAVKVSLSNLQGERAGSATRQN